MAFLFPPTFSLLSLTLLFLCFLLQFPFGVSSLSTVSISETSNQILICALIHSSSNQQPNSYLNCTVFPQAQRIQVPLNNRKFSFSGIVGGNGFLCGLTNSHSPNSPSFMLCWRFQIPSNGSTNLSYKRIYNGTDLNQLDAGNSIICGLNGTNSLHCWQWRGFNSISTSTAQFHSSLTVGENFVCGLLESGKIQCLGSNKNVVNGKIPTGNYRMVSAGFNRACAISINGGLDCWGENMGGESEKPQGLFKSVSLGESRSCGIRPNGTVTCWGLQNDFHLPETLKDTSFESLVAHRRVFCGILTSNYSLLCWGNENLDQLGSLVFDNVMPGPCSTKCPNGYVLPNYARFCSPGLMICQPYGYVPSSNPLPNQINGPNRSSGRWDKRMIAFFVVGCVGCLSLVAVLCFFFFRCCKVRGCRVYDSGPMDDTQMPRVLENIVGLSTSQQAEKPTPVLEKRLSQLFSNGNGSHLEEFSLQVLVGVTDNFSDEHRIGIGSFGSVYRATLDDGREVAIKRAEVTCSSSYAFGTKRQEDHDNAFLNELEFLSRLNHKNLVRLLGFCEDVTERVLVYEYVENGSLHDHLHHLESSYITSWPARIKVALDSARGIEYLHVYAVPPIIHRDIKSSNILLDATWAAKVSDFGLSLMGPQDDESHLSLRAAGTVGYMDPEYFKFQQLTTKSDVYSFGVVLLELLSGYKAIHKKDDGEPRNVVDAVVRYIVNDEIHRVLDPKVPPPTPFEIEAVKYVGYLAVDCVTLEGKDRPSMSELVTYLERALAFCLATPTLSRTTTSSSHGVSMQLHNC